MLERRSSSSMCKLIPSFSSARPLSTPDIDFRSKFHVVACQGIPRIETHERVVLKRCRSCLRDSPSAEFQDVAGAFASGSFPVGDKAGRAKTVQLPQMLSHEWKLVL